MLFLTVIHFRNLRFVSAGKEPESNSFLGIRQFKLENILTFRNRVCAQSFIGQKVTAAATARTALRKRLSSSMAISSKEKNPASQGSEFWLPGYMAATLLGRVSHGDRCPDQ